VSRSHPLKGRSPAVSPEDARSLRRRPRLASSRARP
jgi:hypothetical protein